MKILILVDSRFGHTKKVADFIANEIKPLGAITIAELSKFQGNLQDYQQIILGASVRYGDFSRNFYKFVKINLKALQSVKSAFFGVCLTARKEGKNTPETSVYIQKFSKKTLLKPNNLAIFAGDLSYQKYNFFDKTIIKLIMFLGKGPTSGNSTIEFTDWDKVREFAKKLI